MFTLECQAALKFSSENIEFVLFEKAIPLDSR